MVSADMSAESVLPFAFTGDIPITATRQQPAFTFQHCPRTFSFTPSTFISRSHAYRAYPLLHRSRLDNDLESYVFCMSTDKSKAENPSTLRSNPRQARLKPKQSGPAHNNHMFDWSNQWYPVGLLADLLRSKPNAFKILDIDIVVWQSPSTPNSWTVFHDRCPHRFAALSEGRIDPVSKTLECGYHGWQFDFQGTCTSIPQASKRPSNPVCAKPLPCVARGPLLFVWLGESQPPPDSSPIFVEDVRAKHITSAYSRVLPLCFTTLIQNVLDPAHIHFAHHGQIGHRDLAAPIPIRILSSQSSQGFMADYHNGSVRIRYRPPCLIEIVTSRGFSFAYYAVPVSFGFVRTIAIRGASYRPLFRIPRWLDHLKRNQLVEGDLKLMMTQQREMRKSSKGQTYAGSWGEFYMPTTSDRLIAEMKRWLDENSPPDSCSWFAFAEEEQFPGSSSRLTSHTRECTACSRVRQGLIRTELMSKVLAVCAAAATLLFQNAHPILLATATFFFLIYVFSRRVRNSLE